VGLDAQQSQFEDLKQAGGTAAKSRKSLMTSSSSRASESARATCESVGRPSYPFTSPYRLVANSRRRSSPVIAPPSLVATILARILSTASASSVFFCVVAASRTARMASTAQLMWFKVAAKRFTR
jgi:hypothetical protein